MPKVYFYTLGCKVNQAESKQLAEQFATYGYTITTETPADILVINTCSVTQAAERKARNMLRRLKQASPKALVYVIGCYAAVAREALAEEIPEIHKIIPAAHKLDLAYWDIPLVAEGVAKTVRYNVREFLKVQDGCDQFCAYCIIPYARATCVDLSITEAVSRATELISKGVKELILTGINLGKHKQLPELIKEITALPVLRVRISSLEPQFITRELLEAVQASAKVMPHLHIPLQSGCDAVLQRMQRRYTCTDYLRILELVRAALPGVEITTDIIVGFPGETERDFLETMQFVATCRFSDIHIFAYSVRPGTKAAGMPDHYPPKIIQERVSRLEVLRQKLKQKALQKYIGQPVEVLLDTKKNTGFFGYTPEYHQVQVLQGQLGKIIQVIPKTITEENITIIFVR